MKILLSILCFILINSYSLASATLIHNYDFKQIKIYEIKQPFKLYYFNRHKIILKPWLKHHKPICPMPPINSTPEPIPFFLFFGIIILIFINTYRRYIVRKPASM